MGWLQRLLTPRVTPPVRPAIQVISMHGNKSASKTGPYCSSAINQNREFLLPVHHRHLNHQRFTLAAIDDVISRGRWGDWAELRQVVLADHSLPDKVVRVCLAHVSDPDAQRHHFWMHYAKEHHPLPDWKLENDADFARTHTAKSFCNPRSLRASIPLTELQCNSRNIRRNNHGCKPACANPH